LHIFAAVAGHYPAFNCTQKYKTKLKQLNLPGYSFRIIEEDGFKKIFDQVRKKFVKLTPEEWVRQNFITYITKILGYPIGLITVERTYKWNRFSRRTDILVHNRKGEPVMIVECKAPNVKIDAAVLDQIVCYNMKFGVPLLVLTNGLNHFACVAGKESGGYTFIENIPHYCDIGSFIKGL
jgi:predicted type IV restriction endonuclease